ncbi:hypothetical protein [Streptomyces albipurpureus]|uniref:Small CPxCG-related zinc finger protein n=1 Tax=Streptomyces albipurpureus TaxID=2897419 RepID=A0ABT0V3I1_9ACTN|nr:hypothetical protein [Streptomyces sp. CWNU-1]MCM2393941.1 hypothetical protein [Streptomyces sp. CWNU-1]
MTPEELFPDISPDPIAYCCDCARLTRAPITIRHIGSTNRPGTTLYACPDCFPRLDPGPTPADMVRKK